MFAELTVGQYLDWIRFHNQFNLRCDKHDHFWAIHIADYRNVHRGEGDHETRPIEMLPWVDEYGDDETFLATLRGFAAAVQTE